MRNETHRIAHKLRKASDSITSSPSSPNSSPIANHYSLPASPISSNSSVSPSLSSNLGQSSGAIVAYGAHEPNVFEEDNIDNIVAITQLPMPDLGQLSIGHFFMSYILATPFESYLKQLCHLSLDQDESLSLALNATALAAFSRRSRSQICEARARRTYAKALTHVNGRLQNPETAVQDGTLATVLLLGLFEAIVFRGGKSPTEWTAHTWGAMRLLMIRGSSQFLSPLSLRLFVHASNNIKTACIQGGIDLPPEFRALVDQAEGYLPKNEPVLQISPILNRIIQFKADFEMSPRFELFKDAWRLDCEVLEVMALLKDKTMPFPQGFDTNTLPQYTFNKYVNRCTSLRQAKIWNALHLVRILLMHFLYGGMEWGGFDSTSWPDTSVETQEWIEYLKAYAKSQMRNICEQILATVPAFMEPDGADMVFSTPARSLVWPLSIIEVDALCSNEAQQFASKMLKKLAGELNLPEAVLEKGHVGSSDDWLHLFHLG